MDEAWQSERRGQVRVGFTMEGFPDELLVGVQASRDPSGEWKAPAWTSFTREDLQEMLDLLPQKEPLEGGESS